MKNYFEFIGKNVCKYCSAKGFREKIMKTK